MHKQTTAVFYNVFGGLDTLQVGPLDLPEVGEGDVLVRVKAAGLNPLDAIIREGHFQDAVPSIFPTVAGFDVAGIVEQVGPGVSRLAVGDEVYGMAYRPTVQHGTFAQHIVVPEYYLTARPRSLSWEAAGGLPLVGTTACQALRTAGRLQAGETVLLLGASGGVGSVAIQLAKHMGATVIAVAGAQSAAFMKALGADFTVDYAAGPLAEALQKIAPQGVDLLVDAVSGDTLTQSLAALKPTGRLVSLLTDADDLDLLAGVRFVHSLTQVSIPDLDYLRELADGGKLQVPIASTFPLAEAKKAFAEIESRHKMGKVVLVP